MSKRLIHSLAAAFLALALFPPFPAAAQPLPQDPPPSPEVGSFVPGELVVGFDFNLPAAEAQSQASALAEAVGAQVAAVTMGAALLSFDEQADVLATADRLSQQPGVRFAEPNFIYALPADVEAQPIEEMSDVPFRTPEGEQLRSVETLKSLRTLVRKGGRTLAVPTYPNDSSSYVLWGHWLIGAALTWPDQKVSPMVCVVDTGVDVNHPELKGRALNGYDYVNDDKIANDDNGHGTHVAGIISARTNNQQGVWGLSNGKVLAVKVLGAQGFGTSFNIAQGITYCANSPARIINLSLGGSPSSLQFNALNYAINTKGKLVVAAAGNSSTSLTANAYPAAYAKDAVLGGGLLSVGAARQNAVTVDVNGDNVITPSTETFTRCSSNFSNYGSWVEIIAPGDSIYSTLPTSYPFYRSTFNGLDSYADTISGTSMAAPYVSAVAARVWGTAAFSTPADLAAHLVATGRPLNIAVDPTVTSVTDGYQTTGYAGSGPYCWPGNITPYGAAQDTSAATYLDMAAAMNRAAVSFWVSDAQTGLPLTGAVVRVISGGKVIDTSRVESLVNRQVDLINIPGSTPFETQISAKGYLKGFQTFAETRNLEPGYLYSNLVGGHYAIPSGKYIHLVTTYKDGSDDVNTVLYLPAAAPASVSAANYGNLYEAPFAFYNRDNLRDGFPLTSTTVVNKSKNPYYPGEYYLLVNASGTVMNTVRPTVRVFFNGKIIQSVAHTGTCANTNTAWRPGRLVNSPSGVQFLSDNLCGGAELNPY